MNKRKGPSIYIRMRSKNVKMILKGIKLYNEEHKYKLDQQKYNKYKPLLIFISLGYCFFYIKHNYLSFEFQKRKNPNFLIPKIVYRIRKQHYIYWEKSRLARGLSTTFSFYNYDKESKMLNITDRKGNTSVEKLLFKPGSESKAVLANPYMELIYKQKVFNEGRANRLTAYYNNVYNKYDLDNYLQYKAITPMDFIRVIYYKVMLFFGIADVYRNEQYMGKSDFFYNVEKLLLTANLNQHNREVVESHIHTIFLYSCIYIYSAFKKYYDSIASYRFKI